MPDVHKPEPPRVSHAAPDAVLAWQQALQNLAMRAIDAVTRAPDPALLSGMVAQLAAARRALADATRRPETLADVSPLRPRTERVVQALSALGNVESLLTLPVAVPASALPPHLAGEAASRLARAEARVAEAGRLRQLATALMASHDLAVVDAVAAHRDAMRVQINACVLDLRRVISLLRAAEPASIEQLRHELPPTPAAAPASTAPGMRPVGAAMPEDETLPQPVLPLQPRIPVTERGDPPLAEQDPPPATEWTALPGAERNAPSAGLERLLDGSFNFGRETIIVADRYEIRDLIGRGSLGTVLEAFDRRLGRLVALKVIRVPKARDATHKGALDRFRQEAQAVARLSHPGIVPVHDFGEGEEFAWIVMELVIGETLRDVLERGEAIPPDEAVRITVQLLEALDVAHARGITHRDIKPANIMLAMDAGSGLGRVRLVDLGVARLGGDAGSTMSGHMIGTPSTMSPERVRGEPVDHRADLWASGVVLYQMLTGVRPFAGGTAAVLAGILTHEPAPPSLCKPDLAPGFDEVIRRALAKSAAQRFASAAEFALAVADVSLTAAPVAKKPRSFSPFGCLRNAARGGAGAVRHRFRGNDE